MLKNATNIPISYAVWLAAEDDYDLVPDPKTFSATSLLRPMRSLILGRRMAQTGDLDIEMLISSNLGRAIHTAVEQAWKKDYRGAMRALGYPNSMIDRVRLNVEPDDLLQGDFPIYLERRRERQLDGFTISGKLDLCVDGGIRDMKTTQTYTWVKGGSERDYRLQASIYRWLHRDIVTRDYFDIDYLFTDWKQYLALSGKGDYPPQRCSSGRYELHTLEETEAFIRHQLSEIQRLDPLPQGRLPLCNEVELWQTPTRWAYYTNPDNIKAFRVFDLEADANIMLGQKGKGEVRRRPGEVKRCNYCEARPICTQAEQLQLEGALK